VAKIGKNYHILRNSEKIQYIINNWGDTEDLVIMYNYIAEQDKLQQHFKKALILQATSYAEGVDLHKYKHLVVYSQDFSTARHTQRRARQANKQREEPITVHFLLVKKAISEQVYKTVSVNKKNFVDSVFKRNKL
jgi:ERCC4-related helicase